MFSLSRNGIIQVTRGDSFNTPLFINQGTVLEPVRYILGQYDKVYFGVMECNQPFEAALIRKSYDYNSLNENNDVVVEFTGDETLNLLPGKYYYEVKLDKYDEEADKHEINTIISKREFFVLD